MFEIIVEKIIENDMHDRVKLLTSGALLSYFEAERARNPRFKTLTVDQCVDVSVERKPVGTWIVFIAVTLITL